MNMDNDIGDFNFEKPRIDPEKIPGRKDLVDFFKRQGLLKYLECFPKTVNFAFFKTMSDDDFIDYGITKEAEIQLLLEAVNKAVLEEDESEEAELDFEDKPSATTSPSSPSSQLHFQRLIEAERRRSYFRNNSIEPFSPIRDETTTNLVRMRTNQSLGNSDPSLSSSASDLTRKFSACGFSPRRPKSLMPHSPSPPRAHSPGNGVDHQSESPKHVSPSNPVQANIPFAFANSKSFQSGRRWSVASLTSSGCSTNTPSSGLSSRTSSQERLNMPYCDEVSQLTRQNSHDSTYSDVDEECRSRSPKPFRGRSRSLSPSRCEDELTVLNRLYAERFPKAKAQMEDKLSEFIDEHSADSVNRFTDASISFVFHQILEVARSVLKISVAPDAPVTSTYFYEVSEALDKLVADVKAKTASKEINYIRMMVSNLLIILSRPARLLECLEFDPTTFYGQLQIEEYILNQNRFNVNLGTYIRKRLGLTEDAGEEAQEEVKGHEATPRKASLVHSIVEPKDEDFHYIKVISNGAYGCVYLVRHKQSRQRYALKKMSKNHLLHKNQVQQVFTERDIMTFAQNPFVVTMVCTFETKKNLCMVMEYVEGGDCASLLKNMGPLPVEMARLYFAETLLAVEYIHNYGIIHRDLKPDNLLITAMGHVKLTDFGLSKMGLMNLTTNICEQTMQRFQDVQVFGTPDYIAPEVILRKGYGKPVDYWSLGIILYEFLIGATPFYGETVADLFEMILIGDVEFPEGDDALSSEAVDIIKLLLIQEPFDRLGTGGAQEVKDHGFFNNISWSNLLREKAEFIPQLDDDEDTSYFDTREDRYCHELMSDEDIDDDTDVEIIGNFSTCSPRFSRILSTTELKDLKEANSKETSSNEDDAESIRDGGSALISDIINSVRKMSKDDGSWPSLKLPSPRERTSSCDESPISSAREWKTSGLSEACVDGGPSLILKQSSALSLSSAPSLEQAGDESACLVPRLRKESEADSGISEGSSGSLMSRQISMDSQPGTRHDSGRDTDASTSSCDVSPRRLTHTSSFTSRRAPSPKQPSPLVIDTSRFNPPPEVPATAACPRSAPATPLLKKNSDVDSPPSRLHRTMSTPPQLDLSSTPTIPKFELSASEDETTLLGVGRRARRRGKNPSTRRRCSEVASPPRSPQERDHLGRTLSGTLSLRPPIVLKKKGARDLGFTLQAIRVYIGHSSNYTVQHLVKTVDRNGPAYEAGLKCGDLITHINGEPLQGLQHVDVVRLLLSGSDTITIKATDLSNTSIKTEAGQKREPGRRIVTRKLRTRSRASHSPADESSPRSRKGSLHKKLRNSSYLRRNSSVKRAKKTAMMANSPPSDELAGPGSPGSSPGSPARPGTLPTGLLPRVVANHRASHHRRKSMSSIPVSPLARQPSSVDAARSPSPLASKSGRVVLSPTGSLNRLRNVAPSSPLLRRALSPDRSSALSHDSRAESSDSSSATSGTDSLQVPYRGDDWGTRRIVRTQSCREDKNWRRWPHT